MKSTDPPMLNEVHTWTMHAGDTMFERVGLHKYISIYTQYLINTACINHLPVA